MFSVTRCTVYTVNTPSIYSNPLVEKMVCMDPARSTRHYFEFLDFIAALDPAPGSVEAMSPPVGISCSG